MSAGDITIRPARSDDIVGLRAFGKDIYAGHDYLEVAYFQLLHNKNHFPCVAVKENGEVVGFKTYNVIDDRTTVSMGGRVLPGYQGLGINKALARRLDADVIGCHPALVYKVSVQRGGERTDRFAETTANLAQICMWNTFRGMTNKIDELKQMKKTDEKFGKLSFLRALEMAPAITRKLQSKLSYMVYPGPLSMNVAQVNETNLRHRVLSTCDAIASLSETPGMDLDGGVSFAGARIGVGDKLVIASVAYHGASVDELLGHTSVALQHFSSLTPDATWTLGLTMQFPLDFDKKIICDYINQWFDEQFIHGYRSDFALNLISFDQEED